MTSTNDQHYFAKKQHYLLVSIDQNAPFAVFRHKEGSVGNLISTIRAADRTPDRPLVGESEGNPCFGDRAHVGEGNFTSEKMSNEGHHPVGSGTGLGYRGGIIGTIDLYDNLFCLEFGPDLLGKVFSNLS